MDTEYQIVHETTNEGGEFIVKDGDRRLGHLRWRKVENGDMDGFGTFTEPELRGKGMARKLVDELVSVALENGVGIIPTCPYILRVMSSEESLKPLMREKA